jgi:hypothetical protein
MALQFHRFPVFAGLAAGATLLPAPAAAAGVPLIEVSRTAPFAASAYDTRADINQWGCWGCGWGGGWHGGGWGRGWRRRGPSAGEVLAGVAIIGGIAAIASAANNNRRNRDVVVIERDRRVDRDRDWDRDRRNPNLRDSDRRLNPRASGMGGLDGAVSQCLDAVERDVRVDEVEVVQRTPQGWLVGGTLFNGSGFECRIGNDGRIDAIDYGSAGFGTASSGQFDDSRYAAARLSAGVSRPDPEGGIAMMQPGTALAASGEEQQPLVPLTAGALPTYPGGPVDGEEPAPLVQRPGIP